MLLKKALSYLWPLTTKIASNHNGTLEITWVNGKKILDSKNANYSYGSLERILSFGIAQINLKNVSNTLLLGMGGGSILKKLANHQDFNGHITAIEIDQSVIAIAQNDFAIHPHTNLDVVCADAIEYIAQCQSTFDLVIIDLFIDKHVPGACYSETFWSKVNRLISKRGHVLFNAGIELEHQQDIDKIIDHTNNYIDFQKFELVDGTNTLLIGNKAFGNIS